MSTRGERLSAYLARQTGGRRGWQTALVQQSGVKRQTISKYTSVKFDGYPELDTLSQIAEALKVPLWEIVAAMDGDAPAVPLDQQTVAAIRAVVEEVLDERLGPRR